MKSDAVVVAGVVFALAGTSVAFTCHQSCKDDLVELPGPTSYSAPPP